ncbi:response regulator [Maribellus maritimus]|uniref:response regulator n=1 Tax=Maribellus maritimus TaxID=2870838 RepID=UPI001EE9F32B|nr:response regulator [Maribellus maritimus]MCG6187232.1 response regulator [Maribellus maritimus]
MKKILAIDDSEINLELLFRIFKLHYPEYQFLKALSGKQGIDLAIKERPEIILLDIIMPEMNGYEVCKFLKKEATTQDIPIIMISALGQNSEERTKGLNVGADAFISKPFSQSELRAQINVALRIKKVEDLLRKRNESLELFIKDQTNKYLQNEERFLQISAHALEFYWEVDSKGVFTYVSPAIEKILFIEPQKIIGEMHYLDFFQVKDWKTKKSKIELSFMERSSFNDFELELKLSNKGKIWLAVSGFAVFDKKNNFYGFRGVCYDITTRKNAEIALNKNVRQIKNYQKKLKKLNTEITLVEERERRRIAENLHDSLGQTLSLAFIKLSSIVDENTSPHVSKVIVETSDLLDKAISESRTLTYDLSPPILYELGLIAAFKWKLEQISKNNGIQTALLGENQNINIKKEFNIFLYRIVSELLTNIIKHASANLITLNIHKGKKYYYISVEDDGIGFKKSRNQKASKEGGFGLLSIIERLDSIKGQFNIESEPGKGTRATVLIPLEE